MPFNVSDQLARWGRNPATDASSKSVIAHVCANCATSCCTFWNTFAWDPLCSSCQVSRCPPLRYHGLALSSLTMSTLAIWCRLVRSRDVRSRDFSVPIFVTVSEILAFPVLAAMLLFSVVFQCRFIMWDISFEFAFATRIRTVLTLKLVNHIWQHEH